MKKHTKLGLLGLAAGVGAAGGWAAMEICSIIISWSPSRGTGQGRHQSPAPAGGPQVGQGGGRLPVRGHPVGGWPAAVGRSGPR